MTGRGRRLRAVNQRLMREFQDLKRQEWKLELQYHEMEEELAHIHKAALRTEQRAQRWKQGIQVWEHQFNNMIKSGALNDVFKFENIDFDALIGALRCLKVLQNASNGGVQGQMSSFAALKHLLNYLRCIAYQLKQHHDKLMKKLAEEQSSEMEGNKRRVSPRQTVQQGRSGGKPKRKHVAPGNGNNN